MKALVYGVCYQVFLARSSRLYVVVATMIAYDLKLLHPALIRR